jgi:hypothetical protein
MAELIDSVVTSGGVDESQHQPAHVDRLMLVLQTGGHRVKRAGARYFTGGFHPGLRL